MWKWRKIQEVLYGLVGIYIRVLAQNLSFRGKQAFYVQVLL